MFVSLILYAIRTVIGAGTRIAYVTVTAYVMRVLKTHVIASLIAPRVTGMVAVMGSLITGVTRIVRPAGIRIVR